jgi:DNA-binding transcriptional regulator YdaS (Cro superfamily)
MDAARFRACLEALNWSARALARLLEVNPVTVHRWVNGVQPVPPHIAHWLEVLAQCHEAHPPPKRLP